MRERRRSSGAVIERRRARRLPLCTEITCRFDGQSLSASTANLTSNGCFVETETPAPENAVVELTLHLPDDPEPAKASGRVVRIHRRQDEQPGFAVVFDCIDDATCLRIDSLVERKILEFCGDPEKP